MSQLITIIKRLWEFLWAIFWALVFLALLVAGMLYLWSYKPDLGDVPFAALTLNMIMKSLLCCVGVVLLAGVAYVILVGMKQALDELIHGKNPEINE